MNLYCRTITDTVTLCKSTVTNGYQVFTPWGVSFSITILQEVFIIQLIIIYIVYVLAMTAVRPQLQSIYRVLNKAAIDHAQDTQIENVNKFKVVQVRY